MNEEIKEGRKEKMLISIEEKYKRELFCLKCVGLTTA
jgi:hypothetical protein